MKVHIKNLTFDCIIGILDFERNKEQSVIVHCSFEYDYISNEFIDYSKVSSDIESIMKEKKFELIEHALLFLKKYLKNEYPIKKLKLQIIKPNILTNCEVSVSL